MPEVGTTVRDNVSQRVNNVKNTVKGTIDVFKNVVGDVKERFDLDQATEPKWGRQYAPGKGKEVGSLQETVIAIPFAMANVAAKQRLEFARINRNWFKGR